MFGFRKFEEKYERNELEKKSERKKKIKINKLFVNIFYENGF